MSINHVTGVGIDTELQLEKIGPHLPHTHKLRRPMPPHSPSSFSAKVDRKLPSGSLVRFMIYSEEKNIYKQP